jgi:hypothetical protein
MYQSGDPAHLDQRQTLREILASVGDPAGQPAPPHMLDSYEGAAVERARSRASGVSPWLFVMATALNTMVASVLAVIITLGVVNQERSTADAQDVLPVTLRAAAAGREPPAVDAPAQPAVPQPVMSQPVALRPIGEPDRPLQLTPQRPARFPLQIQPDGGGDEPFILGLSGAPPGTILLGVSRIGSDTWFLAPGSAGRLEIVLPEWSTSVFEIAVVLRRINGSVAAQTKAWIEVPPPAGAAPAPLPADENTARDLMAKADRLIAKGDIVGARALYQRAAELGSAPAALALGTTYDPNRLWSLGVLGLNGNKERARQWYQRASELGSAEAKARLTGLAF